MIADGATFDVGNLLLTTADPTGGTGTISSTNTFNLASTPNGNGIVNILSGATINATQSNSYIAVVAPIVFQRGTININGSAAFVAAESARVTFNQGLFDIDVMVGSSAASGFPLQLRGVITGPAGTSASPNHGIYAVSVPKNDAVTMIIAPDGNFGFTPASGISVASDGIYLQAGADLSIVAGADIADRIQQQPLPSVNASLSIERGTFTSAVSAKAGNTLSLQPANGASIDFRSSAAFATTTALLGNLDEVEVGGDLSVRVVNDLTLAQEIGAPGNVSISTEGTLRYASILSGRSIDLFARNSIVGGAITAGLDPQATEARIDVFVGTGSISTGAIRGQNIDLGFDEDGRGTISTGVITTETLEVFGEGDVTIGGIAGSNLYPNISSDDGFLIALESRSGRLQTGNISAAGFVGLSAGTSIATGNVSTTSGVLALASQDVSMMSVTTGSGESLFISNRGIVDSNPAFSTLEGINDVDNDFDRTILRSASPVRLQGSVTLSGPVSTGYLQAAAGGAITTAALDVSTLLSLNAGSSLTLGNVTTPADVSLTADTGVTTGAVAGNSLSIRSINGAIRTESLTARRGLTLNGASGVATGNLTALNTIMVNGNNGGLSLGNVDSTGGRVVLGAAQSVLAGNIRAAGSIAITSDGSVTAGDLTAGTGPLVGDGMGGLGSGAVSSAPAGIAPGFNAFTLTRCDDCASGSTPLSFTANFFGTSFTNTFVSSNGYLTFRSGQSSYTPAGLGANYSGQPIIAAFFADVDVRGTGSAPVTYGTGSYAGRNAFGATWNGVGYFSSRADKLNNFQIVLSDRADTGAGNFDIYLNYTNVQWETGSVNGGVNGLGGNSAAVGFNAGTGNQAGTFFELPGSRVPGSFINGGTSPLAQYNANGVQGQVLFNVRNGMVVSSDAGPATVTINNSGATGSARNVTVGNITGEAVTIDSAGSVSAGNITIAGAVGASAPAAVAVTTTGMIDISAATGDIVVGGISNAGNIALDAAGNLTINGPANGTAINLSSRDITIGANATVTGQSINLVSRSTTMPALLGGVGGSGYLLDASEIGRLRAGSIAFSQPGGEGGLPGGEAQVIVRDITLVGSSGASPNLIGSGGMFSVSTPGTIRVTGNVRLNDAGAENALMFSAGDSFDVVTNTGSVGVFGSGGALGGRLSIIATDITVADQALFDLAARTDFDDVTAPEVIAAIGTPAAQTRPEGFLQAGRLDLAARDFIAIQNSGTAQIAGGFSANTLTLTSLSAGGDQTVENSLNVVIYGRVASMNADFLTNETTRDAITFVSGEQSANLTGFSAPSVVNGCVIGGGVCSRSGDVATPALIGVSLRDLVDGPLSGQQGDQAFSVPSVQIDTGVDLSALTTVSVVTEPVASAGNASFWQSATLSDGASGLIQTGRRGVENAPQRKKFKEKRR